MVGAGAAATALAAGLPRRGRGDGGQHGAGRGTAGARLGRQPGVGSLFVDVVGFSTGVLAQLWVTGALAAVPGDGRLRPRAALPRGAGLAWAAVRSAPGTVATGVVLGGAVSALLTLPASVAAIGLHRVVGPLDRPPVGSFALASLSDVVASVVTLPFLALVLVLAAQRRLAPRPSGQ